MERGAAVAAGMSVDIAGNGMLAVWYIFVEISHRKALMFIITK